MKIGAQATWRGRIERIARKAPADTDFRPQCVFNAGCLRRCAALLSGPFASLFYAEYTPVHTHRPKSMHSRSPQQASIRGRLSLSLRGQIEDGSLFLSLSLSLFRASRSRG